MESSAQLQIIDIGGIGVQRGQGTTLSLYGVGSCVGVVLYDPSRKVGGVVHPMLPKATMSSGRTLSPFAFVDQSIELLMKRLVEELGADRAALKAVLTGGANMQSLNPNFRLGDQNVQTVREVLGKEGLPIVGEDIGGTHNRSVHLDIGRGQVAVASPMHKWEILL